MTIAYDYTIDDDNRYDAIPVINNFLHIGGVINGNLDDSNFSNSSEFEIAKIFLAGDLVANSYAFGKLQTIPNDKFLQFTDGDSNVLKISHNKVEIG